LRWRLTLALSVMCFLLAAPANALSQETAPAADARITLGMSLLDNGEYKKAETVLGLAYRNRPAPVVEIGLARAKFGLGDYKGVLAVLTDRSAFGPHARERVLLRIEALLKLRRFDEVLTIAGSSGWSSDPAFTFSLARASFGKGDRAQASSYTDEVIRAGYFLSGAWRFRARIALDQNQTSYARKSMERALEAGAGSGVISAMQIEADIRDGKFDLAERAIHNRKMVAGETGSGGPHTVFLDAYLAAAQGAYKEAARKFAAIELWLTTDERGVVALGVAKIMAGDRAQGETVLRRHLEAATLDWAGRDQLAAMQIAKGDYENAAAAISEYVLAPGGAAPALQRRYQLLMQQRRYDLAYETIAEIARDKSKIFVAGRSAPAVIFGAASELARASDQRNEAFRRDLSLLRALLFEAARMDGGQLLLNASDKKRSPVSSLIAGETALAAGRVDEAAQHFERALKAAPDFAAAARLRRLVDVRAGKEKKAAQKLRAFAKKYNANNDAALERAALALREGDLEEAASILQAISGEASTDEKRLILLARLHRTQGNMALLKKLARRISAGGAGSRRQMLAAMMFEETGDGQSAANALKQALAASPNDAAAVGFFMDMMQRQAREDEAIIFLNVLVKRRPAAHAARYALAKLALKTGDAEKLQAHQDAFKSIETPHLEWLEIERLKKEGRRLDALKAAQRLASRQKSAASTALGDVERLTGLGDMAGAEARLEAALENSPENIALWRALGDLRLSALGSGASEAARAAYLLSGRRADAAALFALALWRENRWQEALAMSREAAWAGLPVEGVSTALASALKDNGYHSLSRVIAAQILFDPTTQRDRESAQNLLQSLNKFPPQGHEFKRLRG